MPNAGQLKSVQSQVDKWRDENPQLQSQLTIAQMPQVFTMQIRLSWLMSLGRPHVQITMTKMQSSPSSGGLAEEQSALQAFLAGSMYGITMNCYHYSY